MITQVVLSVLLHPLSLSSFYLSKISFLSFKFPQSFSPRSHFLLSATKTSAFLMETPMILMAADQISDGMKAEQVKPRGRKSSRGLNRKKQPQRGLGVAQLERLRLEERWKKMTGMAQPFLLSGQIQYQAPLPFMDPLSGFPVSCCPGNYGGREVIVNNGELGFENGGFIYGSSMIGGLFNGVENQNQKELSSIPNMQYDSDHFDYYFKKKLLNVRNLGLNGEKDKNSEIQDINGSDFLGLNIEKIPEFPGENSCFTANLNKGAEIKQIHRKGNSGNDSFFMEYEFFPGKNGTCFKEMNQFYTEGSIAVEGEASYYGDLTSNPLDLSLKLSF